jgi:hypothetical protein
MGLGRVLTDGDLQAQALKVFGQLSKPAGNALLEAGLTTGIADPCWNIPDDQGPTPSIADVIGDPGRNVAGPANNAS